MDGASLALIIILAVVAPASLLLLRSHRAMAARIRSLEEQTRWYHSALRISGAGVWQWNLDSDEWTWLEDVFQEQDSTLTHKVPMQEAFYRRVHDDDKARLKAAEEACLAGRDGLLDDYRFTLETGEERWLRDMGRIVPPVSGQARIMIGITVDVTLEKQQMLARERQSATDELTGLANRRGLANELEAKFRAGTSFCLAYIDLNGFKQLNDRFGHAAGDRCLVAFATGLRDAVPLGGFAARLGGDEFVLLLADDPDPDVATRGIVRLAISRARDTVPGCSLGAAVGISRSGDDGLDSAALLAAADNAMYAAKRSGEVVAFRHSRDVSGTVHRLSA